MKWTPKAIIGGTLATSALLSVAWTQEPQAPAGSPGCESDSDRSATQLRPLVRCS